MIFHILDWVRKNHFAIIFFLVIGLVGGLYSYYFMPKDVYPESSFPRFQVIADVGFSSLQETEIQITRPLEEVLRTVPGLTELRSVTERGTSTIDVFLQWGSDLRETYQLIQGRINEARNQIPSGVNIQLIKVTTSSYPMSEYGIWSETLSQEELYRFVRYSMLPRLTGVEGVYSLNVVGGEKPEVWINLDPALLARYNLDPGMVSEAVQKSNHFVFLGKIENKDKEFLGFGGNQLLSLKQIGQIVVATRMGRAVKISDISRIEKSHTHLRRLVSINGHKGIFLDVRKQENIDGIKLSGELDKKIGEISDQFAGKLHIVKWDLSDYVNDSLKGVFLSISIGVFLIIFITWYFLNRLKYALPVIIMLPTVIILEFIVLKIFGQSINIMTLGGLAAALGILSDNATVLTENYIRHRNDRAKKLSIPDSLVSMIPSIIKASLVSLIIFIPLVILSGVPGLFFKSLLFTLVSTIILSLVCTILITPVFIHYFIGDDASPKKRSKKEPASGETERDFVLKLGKLYEKSLGLFLDRPVIIFSGVIILGVLALLLFLKIPEGFMPESDEGKIVFDYVAPESLSLKSVDKMMDGIEKIIQKTPELDFFIRKSGSDLASPFTATNKGEVIIVLKKDRKRSVWEIMENLEETIHQKEPDLEVDLFQILPDRLGDLTGTRKPVLVNIIGSDLATIRETADSVYERLKKIKGLSGVMIDMPPATDEVHVEVNQANARLLGLFTDDVSGYVQTGLYGKEISWMPKGFEQIPIGMRFKETDSYASLKGGLKKLKNLPIYTPEGGITSLSRVANVETRKGYPEIYHKNGSLVISVSAEITGRALSDVIKDIKKSLNEIKSKTITIELSGDYKSQQQSFRELITILLIGMFLIYGALLLVFQDLKASFVVFSGTISSVTFVIIGIYISGTSFDVSAFTGIITTMGIVVNNGIIVMDFVFKMQDSGISLKEAIINSGKLRLRPVLITNLTTFAGFLPLALNLSGGGEVLRPFSIAIISGLTGSVLFSLILMPVAFYKIQSGFSTIKR